MLMLRPDPEEISIFLQSHSQFVYIRRVRAHPLPILLCHLDHPKLMPCRSLWDDGTQSSPDDGTDFVVIVFRDVLYSQHDRIIDIIIIIRQILGGDVYILLAPGNTLHEGLLMTLCRGWFLALFRSFLGGHVVGRLWGWILALFRSFLGEHVVGGL